MQKSYTKNTFFTIKLKKKKTLIKQSRRKEREREREREALCVVFVVQHKPAT
jgi:hypothetical protein